MDVSFRFLGAGRGWRPHRGDRSSLRDDLRRPLGLRPGGGFGPAGRRPLRLLRGRDAERRAALPHGDEPGRGRRRGRPLGPGGDAGGGARPAPLHPDQALPDGLGARARAGRDVQRGDRRPPLQPAGQHRAGRARDRLPARLDPGLGRQRRRRRRAPRRRQSAALFYTKLNDGHERRVYAPERHHEIVGQTLALCELRGHAGRSRRRTPSWRPRSELHVEVDEDHNLALITVRAPGADLEAAIARRAPPPLPPPLPRRDLRRPAAGAAGDRPGRRRPRAARGLLRRGLPQPPHATATCCGCSRCTGSESRPTTSPSPRTTGRELLDYVLADLPQAA